LLAGLENESEGWVRLKGKSAHRDDPAEAACQGWTGLILAVADIGDNAEIVIDVIFEVGFTQPLFFDGIRSDWNLWADPVSTHSRRPK